MDTKTFLSNIRDLIARDELAAALSQLRSLLDNSPKLDEALVQSARFQDIRKQIRLGTVSHAEANLTQNQIRGGLLDLLREIEDGGIQLSESSKLSENLLHEEIERAISIINSKNVVVGSTISAGGNVIIGDTTHISESKNSRRWKFFLFLFVPFLVLFAAFLWYRVQPLSLTVSLDNRTPNPNLPFQKGNITLQYSGRSESKNIETETIFTGIPRGEEINLLFEAPGFVKIDTAFVLSVNHITLPIRRDNSLARIFGTVKDGQGNPVADAQVIVQEITARTDEAGNFSLLIPFDKQRRDQQIRVFKTGHEESNRTYTIVENEDIGILLPKK